MFHLKGDIFLVAFDDDVPRTGRAVESPCFLFNVRNIIALYLIGSDFLERNLLFTAS